MWTIAALTAGAGLAAGAAGAAALRARNWHQWFPAYLASSRAPTDWNKPVHVFIAVCDHFEPEGGGGPTAMALDRVSQWQTAYPRLFERFRDSTGRPPQHSFFFPEDEYQPAYLEALKELCNAGFGDVEIHLHHDNDTAESLEETLTIFRDILSHRHGLLRQHPVTGQISYGFIHGNWALCNSRPDGRWCGVDNELSVLLKTGCYADFTMPSAPSNTQINRVNSIYYSREQGRCSHARGEVARVGVTPNDDQLLLIQGPLLPNFRQRVRGILPRIENGDLQGSQPPAWPRFLNWLDAGVHVAGQPQWLFVKLHTHGCKPGNLEMWLGEQATAFHADLAKRAAELPNLNYHYVTALEMAGLIHQAEQGRSVPVVAEFAAYGAAR